MFLWAPAAHASAAKWRTRFIVYEILSFRYPKVFFKFYEPFWEIWLLRESYNVSCWPQFVIYECFLRSMFPWTPSAHTSVSNWLKGFNWSEILLSRFWRSIAHLLRTSLEKWCYWYRLVKHGLTNDTGSKQLFDFIGMVYFDNLLFILLMLYVRYLRGTVFGHQKSSLSTKYTRIYLSIPYTQCYVSWFC